MEFNYTSDKPLFQQVADQISLGILNGAYEEGHQIPSTTEISKEKQPDTFEENKIVAQQGGLVANAAKKQLEETTGKKVVTVKTAKEIDKVK